MFVVCDKALCVQIFQCQDFSVQKHPCVQISLCQGFSAKISLCTIYSYVKVYVYKSLPVLKLLFVQVSVHRKGV